MAARFLSPADASVVVQSINNGDFQFCFNANVKYDDEYNKCGILIVFFNSLSFWVLRNECLCKQTFLMIQFGTSSVQL
jgi:hypothetical protein